MSKCKGGDSSIIQIYEKTPIMTTFYIKRVLILREPWCCLGGGTISWFAFTNCVDSVNLPLSFQVFDLVIKLTGRFSFYIKRVLILREPWCCLGGGTISWFAFTNCVDSVNLPLSFQVFDLVIKLTGRFSFYIKRVLILREPWCCLGGGTISWFAFTNCVDSVNLPLSFQVFDLVIKLTGRFSARSMKVLLYYLCEDAESLWTQVLIHRVLDHKRHLLQMRTCTY